LIKFLQDAAGKGELDPWDIDVISVIDSFLEQYSQTFSGKSNSQNSYHRDLSETSEAFFAASVLVNLKAQVLESDKIEIITIAPLIGEAIDRISGNRSVSSLFA